MQLPIKCIILGSEAVTHRQKDLENPQGSSKDIETHVYCNPVCSFLVFVAFLAHIRSPSLPDVAQYTGNTGSISTEELHTVASKAGTTKLALPQRKLATGELLPRRRRRSLPPRRAASAATHCNSSYALALPRETPFFSVHSCSFLRPFVRTFLRISEPARG